MRAPDSSKRPASKKGGQNPRLTSGEHMHTHMYTHTHTQLPIDEVIFLLGVVVHFCKHNTQEASSLQVLRKPGCNLAIEIVSKTKSRAGGMAQWVNTTWVRRDPTPRSCPLFATLPCGLYLSLHKWNWAWWCTPHLSTQKAEAGWSIKWDPVSKNNQAKKKKQIIE